MHIGKPAPNPIPRKSRSLDDIAQARKKADADKQKLLDRIKEARLAAARVDAIRAAALLEKRDRFRAVDVAAALVAVKRLRFVDLESTDALRAVQSLNRPSLRLLEFYLTALRDRHSVSILQWPRGARDVSPLHPWAMLATLCGAPERTTQGFKWSPAVPDFRTLYFPWRGHGTGTAQRRTLLDRAELMKRNGLHLTRTQFKEPENSVQLAKLHITLGHLNHLKGRDLSKPHLAHPTLGELYPTFGALGGDEAPPPFAAPVYELLGRVAHGAALHQLHDYRYALVHPETAPFAFFGICPRSNLKRALGHTVLTSGRPPDICLLDLNPPGLSRLGPGWDRDVTAFLEMLASMHPETPVVAITQDVHVHRRISFLLGKHGNAAAPDCAASANSRIVLRSSTDPYAVDPDFAQVLPVKFQFHSAGGKGATALQALGDAARNASDPAIAGLLRQMMGNVRRTMSLPSGLNSAHDALLETEGQAAAEAFLERRSAGTVLASLIRQIDQSQGAERQRLLDARTAVDRAFEEFEDDTPIASLLAETAAALSRKSSPSVIAFATEEERILGEHRIYQDSEQGAKVRDRIASGFLRVSTLRDLDDELTQIESGQTRNSWKRLVVVAPPRDQFALLLGRRWLPEEIIVLADRDFVDRIASTYGGLSTHPDLAGPERIGSRLACAAAAAKLEARARDVQEVDLQLEPSAPALSQEQVIDLTGDDEDEQEVIEIALESGRTIRIRPRGLIIRYDRLADVNPFERATARDLSPGNTIVVPDQAFVQEARTVLPVRVLARVRVAMYHDAVESAVPRLPGSTVAAKARYIADKLRAAGARSIVDATPKDWLNAADHKTVAAERLRPHAPQYWREFRAFMELVGIPAELAEKIWREGIEPLRIDRRRAGARMAQAFVSVLVDPHGSVGALPSEVKEQVNRLRQNALDHLDGVLAVRKPAANEGLRDE
jgi:hypothetical protein